MIKNTVLCLNNEAYLTEKRDYMCSLMEKGIDILAFFDTETTGTDKYGDVNPQGRKDRIIEVGFAFYMKNPETNNIEPLMYKGKELTFREFINPFRESKEELKTSVLDMNPNAFEVHKISKDFLNGEDSLQGFTLTHPAPTFKELLPHLKTILCMDKSIEMKGKMHYIGFNSDNFDIPFLKEEWKKADSYNEVLGRQVDPESLFESSIDVRKIMQSLYSRRDLKKYSSGMEAKGIQSIGFSLDYLSHMLDVVDEDRGFAHGALLDSLILKNIFIKLIETKEYKNALNPILLNDAIVVEDKPMVINGENKSVNNEVDVLTLVKTDASLREGTGTESEYINKAKELNLTNLALIDTVTISRYIDFYEGCKKAEINPIIGTTFKLETSADVFYLMNKDGEASKAFKLVTKEIINKLTNNNYESLESFAKENKAFNIDDWNSIINEIKDTADGVTKYAKKIELYLKKIEKEQKVKLIKNKLTSLTDEIKDLIDNNDAIFKVTKSRRTNAHADLVVLANNENGYSNLKKLITRVNLDGQYFAKKGDLEKGEQPVMNLSNLNEFKEDLSIILGSKNDIIGRFLNAGQYNMANGYLKQLKGMYQDSIKMVISNEDNDQKYIESLINIAKENGIEIIAGQRVQFAEKDDYKTHIIKAAILEEDKPNKIETKANDLNFKINSSPRSYMRSKEFIIKEFEKNNEFLNNAANLIKNTNVEQKELHIPVLPNYETPKNESQMEYLKKESLNGLRKLLPSAYKKGIKENRIKNPSKEDFSKFCMAYKERLDYELSIIEEMGFAGYFLIEQQMVKYCKDNNILVGEGRGSAAGSLVVRTLDITSIDPIEYNLFFERFLNPERKEMPDIDTDIDGEYREQVLKFLTESYEKAGNGFSGAAYIMTKGTYAAKNAIKKVCSTLSVPDYFANTLAGLIPKEPGVTITSELEVNEVLKYRYETEPKTRYLLDMALRLEKNGGKQASVGKHAGGIVVGEIIKHAPITYISGIPVVQFDKHSIEIAGAVKYDLLGVESLSKLNLALKNVRENKGDQALTKFGINLDNNDFSFQDLDYQDEKTFNLIQTANTSNVFQIESNLFKGLLKLIKPQNIEELTAVISLGRPGPLQTKMHELFAEAKFDPSKRRHYHDKIDYILDDTHGTIIYQEQVMHIAQQLSGYTMGGANNLRKAMSKKIHSEMQKQRELFVTGAKEVNNIPEETANMIYDDIETFAGYGFNKSHAVSYAVLCYKMALLRAHYPTEFMSAIMTVDANGGDAIKKITKDIQSCKEVGLQLFSPDINSSDIAFKAGKTNGVLFGLCAIKGSSFKAEYEEREKNGKYKDMIDYICRNNKCSKSIAKLINSGAMDKLPVSIELSKEMKQFITQKPKTEIKLIKRLLLLDEFNLYSKMLSSKDKIKKFNRELSNSVIYESLTNSFRKTLNEYNKNPIKMQIELLSEEKELLGGYITTSLIDIGDTKQKLEEQLTKTHLSLMECSTPKKEYLDSEYSIYGVITNIDANKVAKSGKSYSLIRIDDGTTEKEIYLGDKEWTMINQKLRMSNKELTIGMGMGADIAFYEKDDDLRFATRRIVIPNVNIDFDYGRKKTNNYNNNY